MAEVQQVDYASTAAATSHPKTIANPTAGNLLVLCVVSDNTITTPSGWTSAISAPDFSENQIFYKTASGSEGTTFTLTTGSGHACWTFFEFSGMAASSQLDKTASAINQGIAVSCGTTAATTQASEIAVALVGQSGGTNSVGAGWSDSFIQEIENVSTGTGTLVRLAVATKTLSATGTVTTTCTLNNIGNSHNAGLLATFKASAGGGTTVTPAQAGAALTGTGTVLGTAINMPSEA